MADPQFDYGYNPGDVGYKDPNQKPGMQPLPGGGYVGGNMGAPGGGMDTPMPGGMAPRPLPPQGGGMQMPPMQSPGVGVGGPISSNPGAGMGVPFPGLGSLPPPNAAAAYAQRAAHRPVSNMAGGHPMGPSMGPSMGGGFGGGMGGSPNPYAPRPQKKPGFGQGGPSGGAIGL